MLTVLFLLFAATPRAELKRAEVAYDNYRYAEAISTLRKLLSGTALEDGPSHQKARFVLAMALYLSNKESDAGVELQRLFRENVDYAIDRETLHPDLVRFFDSEHARYLSGLQRSVAQPPAAPAKKTEVVSATSFGDRNIWIRIFPLGIGQFANADPLAGGLFLGVELACIGTNVAAATVRYSARTAAGDYPASTNAGSWQIVQDVSAGAAVVVALFGVIDAFVWSPARGDRRLAERALDLGRLGEWRLAFY